MVTACSFPICRICAALFVRLLTRLVDLTVPFVLMAELFFGSTAVIMPMVIMAAITHCVAYGRLGNERRDNPFGIHRFRSTLSSLGDARNWQVNNSLYCIGMAYVYLHGCGFHFDGHPSFLARGGRNHDA